MSDEKQEKKPVAAPSQNSAPRDTFRRNTSKVRQSRSRRRDKRNEEDDQYDHKIIDIRRVSRMFKGGRRMRLSVFIVVGDRKGNVGVGIGKGADVRAAQQKAITQAKKNMITVKLKGNTIPHDIIYKYKAARVMLKPAAPGTGVVAGSSMRMIAEIAGIKDILGKIMGTNNKITNAYATLYALENIRATK